MSTVTEKSYQFSALAYYDKYGPHDERVRLFSSIDDVVDHVVRPSLDCEWWDSFDLRGAAAAVTFWADGSLVFVDLDGYYDVLAAYEHVMC